MRKIILLFFILPLSILGNDIKCIIPDGARLEVLSGVGQITDPYHYRLGPQKELYLMSKSICLNYFDKNGQTYAFPPSFNVTDIIWTESGDCFFSDSSSIYYRNNECDSVLMLVNTDMHNIRFSASHYGIYYYDSNGTDLWFFSFPRAESMIVCRFPNSISDIKVLDDMCFIANEGRVGIIRRNQEYSSLFKISALISSIAISEDGALFYGTKSGLFYYDSENRQYPIANKGVQELLVDGDNLYIIFSDWSSARLEGISAYKGIADVLKMQSPKVKNQPQTHTLLINGQIDKAKSVYAESIQRMQDNRTVSSGVKGDIVAEYAYTLALNHDFDAALMNIDCARGLGTKFGDFYASQTLTLMGYIDAAQQLMKQAKIPDWIVGNFQGLNNRYKTVTSINRDAPELALKRANKLAANKQTIQAIALFEELARLYPNEHIIYVDYSALWETLGYYDFASQLLQKGIELMPQEQAENKQIFQTHLAKVDEKKIRFENPSWTKKVFGLNPPKMMTYVGAAIAKDMYSLNGRCGLYTSNRFSASLNVGVNYSNEMFSGSIGASIYKAWGIFVGGIGITDLFSKESNSVNLTPSVGLSFLNKKQTSSFDITLSGYVPFSSTQKFSYSISIGKTIYFDLNGLFK